MDLSSILNEIQVKGIPDIPDGWSDITKQERKYWDKEDGVIIKAFSAPMEGWDEKHQDTVFIIKKGNKYLVHTYASFAGGEEYGPFNTFNEAFIDAVDQMEAFKEDWDEEEEDGYDEDDYEYDDNIDENKLSLANLINEIEMYHGSRFDLDCFKISKVGSGIGNQGYGHGIYFSMNELTSMWYASLATIKNPNAASKSKISGEELHDLELQHENKIFLRLPNNINTIQELIDFAKENIEFLTDEENQDDNIKWWIKEFQDFIKIIENYRDGEIEVKKGYEEGIGHIYKVIYDKGEDPKNYNFLYDTKPATQSQINTILNYAKDTNPNLYKYLNDNNIKNINGLEVYRSIVRFFSKPDDEKETYQNLSISGESKASNFLRKAGFDGNNIGNGNEVIIFDPSKVRIINRCKVNIKTGKKI